MSRIDTHIHVWSRDTLRYPFSPHDGLATPDAARTLADFVECARPVEITGALTIQPRLYGYDHSFIFDSAARATIAVRIMPLVNPLSSQCILDLREYATHPLTAGVRVSLLTWDRSRWFRLKGADEFWKNSSDLQLPVGFLMEPRHIEFVSDIARMYPDLPIVVDHMANCNPAKYPSEARALWALADHEQVSVKVSGIGAVSMQEYPYRDMWPMISELYERYGPRRLMWGSDWPHCCDYGAYADSWSVVAEVLSTAPEDDRAAIFSATAERVFRFRQAEQRQDATEQLAQLDPPESSMTARTQESPAPTTISFLARYD